MNPASQDRRVDRGFWILFVGGWAVYGGLMVSTAAIENQSAVAALAPVVFPLILATLVASRRRRLLNPGWPLVKTAGIHLGVGIAYAVVSALGTMVLLLTFDPQHVESMRADVRYLPVIFSVSYLLLYTILAGFMMWTESMKRVQEAQALLAREAVLRAEAEAKAVRAQFNPHFVFNTLHSLILLVRADPSAAERAIEDVASLIRYASVLDRRGLDAVPLGQEMEVARRYLALESLRLSNRMRVEWNVDPAVETVPVPPFSLLTLLENAIKHGIAPKEEGGRIHVGIHGASDHVAISVEDDGVGAAPETVSGAEGRGLNLLQRRVASLFGEAASLTWRTAPGMGFRALLKVPIPKVARIRGPSADDTHLALEGPEP